LRLTVKHRILFVKNLGYAFLIPSAIDAGSGDRLDLANHGAATTPLLKTSFNSSENSGLSGMYKRYSLDSASKSSCLLSFSQIRQGISSDTKGTAFVVYEEVNDAKQACDKLNGFNFQNRYLVGMFLIDLISDSEG
jgi:RNA recognition motif-containing protein